MMCAECAPVDGTCHVVAAGEAGRLRVQASIAGENIGCPTACAIGERGLVRCGNDMSDRPADRLTPAREAELEHLGAVRA